MSELTVTTLPDRPRLIGGPSAVKCSTPPETNIISGTTLKLAGGPSAPQWRTVRRSSLKTTRDNNVSGTNCQISGRPSSPQGRTVRRTDHRLNQRNTPSLVQFELERRTVRPPGPNCPPVTSSFHQSQTCSLVRVRTVHALGSGLSALVQSALKLVLFQILSKRR